MATAKQLLKEAAASNIDGISTKIEVFLKDVRMHLGHEEARLYSDFVQNCLHAFVMKLRNLKDSDHTLEILKTCIVCGRGYIQLLPSLEKDQKHIVSSLLYHIIHGLQDNMQVFADQVIEISDLSYRMLDAAGFPESSHTIASAWHGCLWNNANRLLKQGSSQTLKHVLQFRRISLLFICSVPLKHSSMVSMFQYLVTHYTQFNKEWIDKGTSETFYSIFQAVTDKLKTIKDEFETGEEKSVCVRITVRVQAVLVEYLLKVSDYDRARQVVTSMAEICDKSSLLRSAVDNYSYAVSSQEAIKTSQTPKLSREKLITTNSDTRDSMPSAQKEELRVLFGALLSFIQSFFNAKGLENLELCLLKELIESCKVLLTLTHRLQSECGKLKEKEADKKKQKALSDECLEYVSASLQAYYRQLQFMHKLLENNAAEDLCRDSISTVEKYQQFLEENVSVLPKKNENVHRYNLGYICSIIGSACIQAGKYEAAASMYKVAIKQLHICQKPNLLRVFEKLLECYVHLENWKEATQTVYQALITVEDGLKQVVVMWIKQKKEACVKEDIFQSLTLNAVVKSSGNAVKGVSSRQLLVEEYQAWKLCSRRQYLIEYHILRELLDTPQTPVQKAEVLVALAATLCITGYNPEDLSPGEMLNRAIILFDKNLAGSESSLAVACYTKYVLLHEEAIEYMKNDSGEVEYYGKGDVSENSRFTLQQEQENLPFLVRAIELWEKSLSANQKAGQRSCDSSKAGKTGTKKSEEKDTVDTAETLFGLDHHVDSLILCGTRLIAMKQPQLALRALQVAKDQLSNVKDSKRACDLSVQLSRALMLLGRYKEAESVVDGKGDNKKQASPLNLSLLLSELYMVTGKRDTGLEILQSVLDSNELLGKTQKVYLIQGTAKRLLSIALCLPGSDHMIQSANQYLLSLAFEAVQCHLTVINYLTKSKSLSQNVDKWLILNEVLSSLLHLCQLCRFIGLPREALCYLKAGLNISQGQGLPRWSCEFLMEMLGVQSMEAECEKALQTAESLDCILSTENQSKSDTLNQSRKGSKSDCQSHGRHSSLSNQAENENFGFQDTTTTLTMKIEPDSTEKTPERVYVKKELDSEKKNKMRKLKAPDCMCMTSKSDHCTDTVRHRLCMKAGIVMSDFLAQADLRNPAYQLLSKVQSKFEILSSLSRDGKNGMPKNNWIGNEQTQIKNGNTLDPQLLYSYLEACCIKAEYYLHQKNFHKVHELWKSFQTLEQSGKFSNVVHCNILLTRLALCDASSYMMSLYGNKDESLTKLDHSGSDLTVDLAAQKLERLSLNPRRKVSFESEVETLTATGTSMKKVKKRNSNETLDMKPPSASFSLVNTPKPQQSARKARKTLTTPSSNRMDVLEKLIASDDEDDIIVFPYPKPVTPGSVLKSSRKSRVSTKCKTEPRNTTAKKPAFVIAVDPEADNNVACKLDFLPQPGEESNTKSVDDGKSKPKKVRKSRKGAASAAAATIEIDCTNDAVQNETNKTSKRKSRIPKSARNSTQDQTKTLEKTGEDKLEELCGSSNGIMEHIDENILKEDQADNKSVRIENPNQFKGDVFDFALEASPAIDQSTKPGKGKAKVSQKGKKANTLRKINSTDENDSVLVGNKENVNAPKTRKNTKRGKAKNESENTELVRGHFERLEDFELEISLGELISVNDIDSNDEEERGGNEDLELLEPDMRDWFVKTEDDNLDPIEIMRGKTSAKPKTGKKSGRDGRKVINENVTEELGEDNSSGEDNSNTSRSVEQMRSGRLTSINDLDILDHMIGPSVSCVEIPQTGGASPCESDIIPTLQSLYERLCQFPPSPQHSDVCHILALHYLDTDPRRAAFLLSDAMAVTFRHRVMLNTAKKARREAKDSSAAAPSRTASPSNNIMFGRDDLKLTEMLGQIPEDWCVVQLSVVSVGLPWKQMILTRFVKDKDPVVLKLPGFSSPQGSHILKDFSLILERNAETTGIVSTSEWWSARRKLDTDMEALVDRIEKHLVGCWRGALIPGDFPQKILDIACKEVNKIVQKAVQISVIELLLMASRIVTEKELVQCLTDTLGPRAQSSHIDSVITVLKKYRNLATSNSDKQHTILILDKTLQHLPWESIPILSERSVSRMPCLSHVVMQLADHQSRKNSVFIEGVNPKNTFYILNPDSDLPRTEEFFKDWFESEKDWSGVIGRRPTNDQFIDALTKKDFFIYCGHGTGGRIFTSDEIEKLSARAVTMLMGCSSGRLLVKGQFEPSGMMISYFLAGCPSMVANLWDVTDKDIDKFTEEVIKAWVASKDGTYLPRLVQKSRAVCKLKYLNGLAPVVYGLPVFINKAKK